MQNSNLSVSEMRVKNKKAGSKMEIGEKSFEEVAQEWLEDISASAKITTASNYRFKLQKHILPYFAGVKYGELTPAAAREFAGELPRKGLSPKYTEDILVLFKMVTRYTAQKYCLANPADSIVLHRRTQKEDRTEKQSAVLTEPMQRILCRELLCDTDLTKAGVFLALMTGLRLGELCAMQWSHIDLKEQALFVEKTLQRISTDGGTQVVLTDVRSGASRRRIPMTQWTCQVVEKFAGPKDAFFLSGTDTPVDPRTMQNRFKAILRRAGLPGVEFSALRDMFMESCGQLGMDAVTLSRLMGNTTFSHSLTYCQRPPVQSKVGVILSMREQDLKHQERER